MGRTEDTVKQRLARSTRDRDIDPETLRAAKRTAFVARFIVLREGRRSRAHRVIEELVWDTDTTAEDLFKLFRHAVVSNGDKLQPVDRDLNRALEHAEYSADYFSDQYLVRSCLSFKDALDDYERSNRLLFGDNPNEPPRSGGWRLTNEMLNGS